MDDILAQMKRGAAIAVLAGALAIMVWFAPVSAYPTTSKGQVVAQVIDAVILPLVGLIGKMPLIGALGVVAVLGVGYALGLRLPRPAAPDFPPLPQRRAHDEGSDAPVAPLARRRGLASLADQHTHGAEAIPPRKPSTAALEEQMRAVMGADFTLTDDIADRAMDLAAEWQRRGTPHGVHVDPVAIIRKPREKDRDWSQDRSWFGGLPRLGGAAWPRDRKGAPLPFIAQLDLAEIAAAHPDTPLPRAGSLAFFINQGAVIHVPPGDHPPTPAPDDLLPAYQEDGYSLPQAASPVTRQTFPFWPVEPLRMRLPDDLPAIDSDGENIEMIEAAQFAAVERLAPRRRYFFSTGTSLTEGIAGAETLWWYGAELVLRQLQTGLEALPAAIATREKWIAQAQGYQLRLAAEDEPDEKAIAESKAGEARNRAAIPLIEVQGRRLAEFTARFAGFASGRDPWDVMPDEAVQLLTETIQTARHEFPELCGYTVSSGIRDIRNACIRRMITGEAAAAAAIPDALLALINRDYRLPTSYNHQMFGLGGCRQYARDDHLCDHLLLQIVYDDLPEFRFGDMGLWQFWIAPEDLAAGRWDKVQLTFECS